MHKGDNFTQVVRFKPLVQPLVLHHGQPGALSLAEADRLIIVHCRAGDLIVAAVQQEVVLSRVGAVKLACKGGIHAKDKRERIHQQHSIWLNRRTQMSNAHPAERCSIKMIVPLKSLECNRAACDWPAAIIHVSLTNFCTAVIS